MTIYDIAALACVLYLAWHIGCLRVRVSKLEAQTKELHKTLDSNGIYL